MVIASRVNNQFISVHRFTIVNIETFLTAQLKGAQYRSSNSHSKSAIYIKKLSGETIPNTITLLAMQFVSVGQWDPLSQLTKHCDRQWDLFANCRDALAGNDRLPRHWKGILHEAIHSLETHRQGFNCQNLMLNSQVIFAECSDTVLQTYPSLWS